MRGARPGRVPSQLGMEYENNNNNIINHDHPSRLQF